MRYCVIFCSIILYLTGCVRASTHEALQAKYNRDQQQLTAALNAEKKRANTLDEEKKKLTSECTSQLKGKEKQVVTLLKDRSNLQGSIEEMESALREQSRRQAKVDARIASFKALINRFKPLINTGKLKVKIADGRMVVVLATDILFNAGSAKLSKDGRVAISGVSQVLATFPHRTFQVEGHTDNDPISTKRYPSNWELASGRALTVVKTMIDAGLPATQISGASYGEHKPISSNKTEEEKMMNRRIAIVITPDLSQLPGFEELQQLNLDPT